MYKDRTEQRRVTETMNALLLPLTYYLDNETAIIVKRALNLLGEIVVEPQESEDKECYLTDRKREKWLRMALMREDAFQLAVQVNSLYTLDEIMAESEEE